MGSAFSLPGVWLLGTATILILGCASPANGPGGKSTHSPTVLTVDGFTVTGFTGETPIGTLTIPTGVTAIGPSAFINCHSLTGVSFPSSLTKIDSLAFAHTGLTRVVLPAALSVLDTSAFADCQSLTSLQADEANSRFHSDPGSGVLFDKSGSTLVCFPLGLVSAGYQIPPGVTAIGPRAFAFSHLSGVTLPASLTDIGEAAFYHCANLDDIILPASLKSIGLRAFSFSGLKSISLPSGLSDTGVSAFDGCPALATVVLAAGVTIIDRGSFSQCPSLVSMTIPDGVTFIGEDAFSGSSGLNHLTIPSSVGFIDSAAFFDCSSLTDITIVGSPQIFRGVFSQCPLRTLTLLSPIPPAVEVQEALFDTAAPDFQIQIPEGAEAAYQTAPGWNAYIDRMVTL